MLSIIFSDFQTIECSGKIGLGGAIFLNALLLQKGLPCIRFSSSGSVGIDLLRALCGISQNQDFVVLNLHNISGYRRRLRRAVGELTAQDARDYSGDHVAVVGQNAQLAARRGDGQRGAVALIKDLIGGQNTQAECVAYSALLALDLDEAEGNWNDVKEYVKKLSDVDPKVEAHSAGEQAA